MPKHWPRTDTVALRPSRDGYAIVASVRQPPSTRLLIARTIAEIFLVPAVVLIVVWVVAGSGFGVSVPVEREAGDQVRSYE
jgi:hypothetical protein